MLSTNVDVKSITINPQTMSNQLQTHFESPQLHIHQILNERDIGKMGGASIYKIVLGVFFVGGSFFYIFCHIWA